jgi:hypothetical protein
VVFDLQSLSGSAALDACLQRVLGCGGGAGSRDAGGGGSGSGRARPSAPRLPGMGIGKAAGLLSRQPRSSGSREGSEYAASLGRVRTAAMPAGSGPVPGSHTSATASVPSAASAAMPTTAARAEAAGSSAAAPADAKAPGPPPLKCGVGISEDLARLARTHPGVAAFRALPRVLDLRHPWQALQIQQVSSPSHLAYTRHCCAVHSLLYGLLCPTLRAPQLNPAAHGVTLVYLLVLDRPAAAQSGGAQSLRGCRPCQLHYWASRWTRASRWGARRLADGCPV